jgi:hypothetical protein
MIDSFNGMSGCFGGDQSMTWIGFCLLFTVSCLLSSVFYLVSVLFFNGLVFDRHDNAPEESLTMVFVPCFIRWEWVRAS